MIRLEGVLMIAAHSARSQAYLQTLITNGITPAHVLLLGEAPVQSTAVPKQQKQMLHDVLLPDLNESLATSLSTAGIPATTLETRDINADEVVESVRRLAPRLVIFSGYGGQIVGDRLIDLGVPLLHVHSGWLPEYRGSTTVYYSLLEERCCAASAIILDKQIDTGPVLARKHYPAPPLGTDIDRRYDTAIRADLLLDVLRAYHATGRLDVELQQHGEGQTYYVIHPLLKHLALLSLPGAEG
jgi:methionyl-tRNA formyltransferase